MDIFFVQNMHEIEKKDSKARGGGASPASIRNPLIAPSIHFSMIWRMSQYIWIKILKKYLTMNNAYHVNYKTFFCSLLDSQFVPEQAINENSKVGWLFSSKAIVQLLANPIIGPITNRYV